MNTMNKKLKKIGCMLAGAFAGITVSCTATQREQMDSLHDL